MKCGLRKLVSRKCWQLTGPDVGDGVTEPESKPYCLSGKYVRSVSSSENKDIYSVFNSGQFYQTLSNIK